VVRDVDLLAEDVVRPTRLVADRIAEAPREACNPPPAIEAPASPLPPAPPGEAAALVEAMAPADEPDPEEPLEELELPLVLPPPEDPRFPPELNEIPSRPLLLRLPRNRGVSSAAALAAAVEPVKRKVRSSFPPRTVWVRTLACTAACSVWAWLWRYHKYPATVATTRPSRIIHP